jgi:hypothetical protein
MWTSTKFGQILVGFTLIALAAISRTFGDGPYLQGDRPCPSVTPCPTAVAAPACPAQQLLPPCPAAPAAPRPTIAPQPLPPPPAPVVLPQAKAAVVLPLVAKPTEIRITVAPPRSPQPTLAPPRRPRAVENAAVGSTAIVLAGGCGRRPCCCEDAPTCVTIPRAEVCFNAAGVRAFSELMHSVAIRGVENATARGFDSTAASPACKDCRPAKK